MIEYSNYVNEFYASYSRINENTFNFVNFQVSNIHSVVVVRKCCKVFIVRVIISVKLSVLEGKSPVWNVDISNKKKEYQVHLYQIPGLGHADNWLLLRIYLVLSDISSAHCFHYIGFWTGKPFHHRSCIQCLCQPVLRRVTPVHSIVCIVEDGYSGSLTVALGVKSGGVAAITTDLV